MTAAPMVSIVLPCRNEATTIHACLQSISAQSPPPGGFELIVADGQSEDGTREIVMDWASHDTCVRLVDNPGRIVSCGLNAAIRVARGSIIVRMDAHTQYAPDYVLRCVEALKRTRADNVGGPWVARGHTWIQRVIAAAFQSRFAVGGARSHQVDFEGPVDTVYLGCWPRTTFQRFGMFDEELVRNQDDEHNLRIIRRGGTVWQDPSIRSWYEPRSSFEALFRQYVQYGYWKVRVIQKHRLPASVRHIVPAVFLGALILGATVATILATATLAGARHLYLATTFVMTMALVGGMLGVYSAAVATAAVVTARRHGRDLLPGLPAAFLCVHFGYGWGFLNGVLDFLILRQQPRSSYQTLTRPAAPLKHPAPPG